MHKLLFIAATGAALLSGIVSVAQPRAVLTAADLHFCGELLPQHLPDVLHRWNKTLARQAGDVDYLLLLKKRSAVVFPIIEPMLERYSIPKDFKYLPLVESALNGRAVSRKGAAGFWQLMPQTARDLGLRVSRETDDRFNLQKSTLAACKFIWDLYRQFGSWTLVAAAYNAGPTYITRLRRQHPGGYPITLPFKAAETKAYVYQAIALKELLTRPKLYNDLLSMQAVASLSRGLLPISITERMSILEALETPTVDIIEAEETVADDDDMLLTTDVEEELVLAQETAPIVKVDGVLASSMVETRSLSREPLTDGQLCVFEVIKPQTVNGVAVHVGDLIYAHVELLDRTTGRAYLRAEKIVTAQTQETIRLHLTAVERTKHPGVAMPPRDLLASGWKLNWEQI